MQQYICEVVVTNIQDEPAEIEIMYQIPEVSNSLEEYKSTFVLPAAYYPFFFFFFFAF